jgi:hypothetical protein
MSESFVKRNIVKTVRAEGGYARRIEDQFSVGMPDLVLIPLGCPVIWAEVKLVPGNTFGPTPRQLIELTKLHHPPYSLSIMIGSKNGVLYLSRPQAKIKLEGCIVQQQESISDLIRRSIPYVE